MAPSRRCSLIRSALYVSTLSATLFLSGCGTTPRLQTLTNINTIDIPAAQKSCPEIPTPPDPDDPNTTQRTVALYIAELVRVAEHCKRDLDTINRIIAEYNALAEQASDTPK